LASVAYGSETSEIFTVTVTGQSGDGHPEGTVAVYNSTTKLCGATLIPVVGHSASVTCSLTAHELAGGSYSQVFATYSPGTPSSSNASYTYGSSSSTPAQAFSVASVKTTATTMTSLELSARRVTYGDEQVLYLSVTVSPRYPGSAATGTVTIKESTTTLCVLKLSSGKRSCRLAARRLNAGTYHLVATYSGSTNFKGSTSARETLIVTKATSKTALKLSATRVTYGHEQVLYLSVTVFPRYPGSVATGTVTIKESTTTLCVLKLSSGKRSCRLAARRLNAGTYHLVATYGGSTNFKGSTSAKESLTVAK
jgi:hypothetical protein